MICTISHLAFQQYWWIIVSLLAAVLVFLLFVQGGQTLLYTIGRNEAKRSLLVNSLGRKWEFTFTTLVVFGGAFFASFPLFYSTSFGGAYWLWMAILFCFIIQAISYEYRSKPANVLGKKTFETFLFINGAVGTFLLGVTVATLFTGANFIIDFSNLAANNRNVTISSWANAYHGLEAVAYWKNILLGIAVFFLARSMALMYFINNINDSEIYSRSKKALWLNALIFLVFFVTFLVVILFSRGYAYDPETNQVFLQSYKYFYNLVNMPIVGVLLLTGIVLVLFGIGSTLFSTSIKGIWFAGSGVIVTVFSLFLCLGFNHTAFYPSLVNPQYSLTIENSSSSLYTLRTMSYVSLLVPFVAAYIFYAWRAINKKQLSEAEFSSGDNHVY